ncbi:aminodeoxychorismate synthase component I [Arsenicibacter rosenii]|uniref:Aminodeoxychorismate synthase component I n=2 Tax=Arsenicibacter rosenii TaxID=1750698 RepID=A0A1S2VJ31_9BACT|nr:aminodeoxychorismate synthase component I [Arsenicibacter rosenii]
MNEYGSRREPFFFMFDFALEKPLVIPAERIHENEILFMFNGRGNASDIVPENDVEISFRRSPVRFEQYSEAFKYVICQIRAGNSFLVNLSAPTAIATNASLDALFRLSTARYKLRFRNEFVCFSPEIFVQIQGNRIASFPMKGTIDASLPDAATRILADPKEAAEHATIVDLIRNDISQIADKVWVERYRYLEEVKTQRGSLLQVSSEIAGLLPGNWPDRLGDLFLKLLPAGSISGAPKPKTLEIIRTAEWYDRGYYTGVAGYFDGRNLDSGVLIRFIEQQENGLVFKSGGGITAQSDVYAEYQELIDKVYLPIPHRESVTT